MIDQVRAALRKVIPHTIRRAIIRYTRWPPVGRANFRDLHRLEPISRSWGGDRGLPIDRYYIEQFLASFRKDIRGRVLEIGSDTYIRKFGGERITKADVLHVVKDSSKATIIADLADAPHIPSNTFDCIICTQTLQQIFDAQAALLTLYRILKSEGVLLATFPGISQIDRDAMSQWGDYWRFTALSARNMFMNTFPSAKITVQTHGNVFSAVSFLHGLASEELTQEELDFNDKDYQVLITVRAIKGKDL
ncbi:MAG: methyltransferase domain-containing protein [Anaerolineales bacterium]|jgi:SAM-dependent methyltransferase